MREELGGRLHAVWLYGSRARGEPPGPESDIDLLVITDGGRADDDVVWRLAMRAAEEAKASPLVMAPSTYDPARVEDRRRIRSFFIQEVDRDKIVLYGSPWARGRRSSWRALASVWPVHAISWPAVIPRPPCPRPTARCSTERAPP